MSVRPCFASNLLMKNLSNPSSNATNPNQASDRGAALAALGAFLGHRFATSHAESQVLARAAVELRRRAAGAARRLQHQIHRRPFRLLIYCIKIQNYERRRR